MLRWQKTRLGEIAQAMYGYTESASFKDVGPKFLRITDLQNDGVVWDSVPHCKIDNIDLSKYTLKDGDIVFARTGATTGKSYLVRKPPLAVFASYLIKLSVSDGRILPDFLYKYFQTQEYWDAINNGVSGSAQGGVNASKLSELHIPLPPLPEQKRIVAILDEAFSGISRAKEIAEKNLANSREIFESYLHSVFANPGGGWEEKMLGDPNLVEIIDGDRGKNYPSKRDFTDEGFCLFMNTKNVRPDGLLFETKMFITEKKDFLLGNGKLNRNDVVMTTRGTIGNIGIYSNDIEYDHIRINSGMLIFRPNQTVITSEYLFEMFRSGIMKRQIEKHVSGAAQPQLPIKTLVRFTIPVPCNIAEQNRIVKRLKELKAETGNLESIYKQKLTSIEELKKSLLHQAFSGSLTGGTAS